MITAITIEMGLNMDTKIGPFLRRHHVIRLLRTAVPNIAYNVAEYHMTS